MINKKKISAEIIADSINQQGDRVTTMLLTFPRFILAELNTHRLFSKNSASSRAIPFKTMVKSVEEDPFVPIAWMKDHKGMQGIEYFTIEDDKQLLTSGKYYSAIDKLEERWLTARDKAVQFATDLNTIGLTKQLCNRLLEPFMWHTVLLTSTEFDNFYDLRLSENVEIHMRKLAQEMKFAMNYSLPKELKSEEWHIPFGDKIDLQDWYNNNKKHTSAFWNELEEYEQDCWNIKIATARAARLSYMTFDGNIDYKKDLQLYNQLLESKHLSPFEHCCRALTNDEYNSFVKGKIYREPENMDYIEIPENIKGWCNNFKGFIQLRYLLENGESI